MPNRIERIADLPVLSLVREDERKTVAHDELFFCIATPNGGMYTVWPNLGVGGTRVTYTKREREIIRGVVV